jgi:hypothetical protein
VYGSTKDNSSNSYAKIVEVNGMIIGSVGVCEESSLMQLYASTRKPISSNEAGILEFISEFATWKKGKTGDWGINNSYIIVFEGKAFCVESFFVWEITKYTAIGAGRDFALAGMELGKCTTDSVILACKLSLYCALPTITFSMPRSNK